MNHTINEEDFVVASLAKLVGSELHTIDKYTESTKSSPANKLDPRAFLSKQQHVARRQNPNIVKHEGMMFHAGIDENLVQSMYPDPVPQSTRPEVASPVTVNQLSEYSMPQAVVPIAATNNVEFEKLLKSIDRSLKSIDKTQKLLVSALSSFNLTNK